MKLPIKISGVVKKHVGRGRKLGFPTANLDVDVSNLEEGIYVGYTRRRGEGERPSLIFIGAAKTFGETEKHAEVYILDFFGDLYGRKLEVELLKKIRDNRKFENETALIAQMREDEKIARKFSKNPNS